MEDVLLTGGEWNVMRELWDESPQTLMQLVAKLSARVGWAKSTTITTLRRMEGKGLVSVEQTAHGKSYAPLVAEADAARRETEGFLSRVYGGSLGLMMSALVNDQKLTKEDIDELSEILRKAGEGK